MLFVSVIVNWFLLAWTLVYRDIQGKIKFSDCTLLAFFSGLMFLSLFVCKSFFRKSDAVKVLNCLQVFLVTILKFI